MNIFNKSWAFIAILFLIINAPVMAKTGYVTDETLLNMYPNKGTGKKLKTLNSGDKVEVLEETRSYAKVKAADGGETGWVKKRYLVEEPPAKVRLPELEAQLIAKDEEIARLNDKLNNSSTADLQKSLEAVNLEKVELFNEKTRIEKNLRDTSLELDALKQKIEREKEIAQGENTLPPYVIPVVALLGTLLLGFILGYIAYGNKLKRRFYGHKI